MIARTQTGRVKLLNALRHSVVVVAGAFLLAAAALGAEIVLKNGKAVGVEHQNELLAQQIRATSGEVERAKRITTSKVPTDLSAVAKLQSDVEQLASERECTVTEFRASSEVVPYLTRFAKTSTVSGWGQVEVQISLSGKAKNVAATLAGVVDSEIPYEFDALEITRDKVDEVGDATVIGHATLRVLIRTSKVAA